MPVTEPLLVHAGVVATPNGLVRDRVLRLEDGIITAMAPAGDLAGVAGTWIGGPTTFVVPGFVNAHQHGMPHGWAALGCSDGPLEPWMVDILHAPGVDPYEAT